VDAQPAVPQHGDIGEGAAHVDANHGFRGPGP
jgi:hypothetical protein